MKWIRVKRRTLLVVSAVALLVMALQLPWSLGQLARIGLHMSDLDIRFASLRGHWLTTLEIHGLAVELNTMHLTADTVRVGPNVFPLIVGRFRVRELTIVGADVHLKESAIARSDSAYSEPLEVIVDQVTVRRGRLTLPDSAGTVSSVFLDGWVGADAAIYLDSVAAEMHWPGGSHTLTVAGRAQFAGEGLLVDTLSISGPESHIYVYGHYGVEHGTDIHLAAAPLRLSELSPWLPASEESLALTANLVGSRDTMQLRTEADFTDGGYAELDLTLNPVLSRWALDTLFISNLNPALILEGIQGHVSAYMSGQLTGRSVDSLSGTLRLIDMEGQLNGVPIEGVRASADLERGHATMSVSGRLASARVDVKGDMMLSDKTGRLTGEFGQFDIGQYLDNQSSALGGSISMDLQQVLTAEMVLNSGRLGNRIITGGHIAGRADAQMFEWTGHVNTDQGTVAIGSNRQGSILTAYMELVDLDISGLAGQAHDSRVNAQLSLNGRWPPDSLELHLAADSSRWDDLFIDAATAHVLAKGHDIQAILRMDTNAGRIHGYGHVIAEAHLLPWTVSEITAADVDLSAFGAPFSTSLDGSIRLSGRGLQQAKGAVRLDRSSLGEQIIDSAHVSVDLLADRAIVSGRVNWPDGGMDLHALADSIFDAPSVAIPMMQFENLNLGAVMNAPSWQTQLTGAIDTAYWHGGSIVSAGAIVRVDSSSINDQGINSGSVDIRTNHTGLAGRIRFDLPDGHVKVDTVLQRSDGSFETHGTVEALDLQALAGLSSRLSGRFDLMGSSADPDSLVIDRVDLQISGADINGIDVHDSHVAGSMRDLRITLDTLRIGSNLAHIQGTGQLALQGGRGEELVLSGQIVDASPLEPWLGSVTGGGTPEDTFRVYVESRADTLRFDVGVGLGPASLRDLRVFNTRGAVQGHVVNLVPTVREASFDISRISVPALAARTAALAIRREGEKVLYDAQLTIDDRRLASINGFADLTQQRVVLQDLEMRLDEDHWRLDRDAVISTGDQYRIRNLLLVEDAQEVAIDGVLDFDGQQNLGISLYNVQLGRFADLLGFEGLGGTLDGDLFLSGASDGPVLDGSVAIDVKERDRRIGDLELELSYENYRLGLDVDLTHEDGSYMHVIGHVPIDLRLAKPAPMPDVDVSLAVKADGLNLKWLSPFTNPEEITELSGRLTADLDVTGTARSPGLAGNVDLEGLQMSLPQSGINITEGRLQTRSAGDSTRVEALSARSHQGELNGHGHVILEDLNTLKLDLNSSLSNFRLVDTRAYQADANGSLELRGTLSKPELYGRLDMTGAVIRPQEAPTEIDSGPVAFTETDVRMLEQYFNIRVTDRDTTTYSLVDALSMDLEVGVPGNVWLRSAQNPEMDIALAGSLRMTKAAYEDEQVTGTLSVVPQLSSVHQFGRRFDIRSGRVTFAGPALDPYFDLQAAMAVREHSSQDEQVSILLEVEGWLQDTNSIEFNLRSEPFELDPADILLYIATGRPAADAFQATGANTLEAGSSLAISQLNTLIAGAASAGLGLDVVRIQQAGSRGLTVTAGKHISRRLFTSVSWPLTSETLSDVSRLGNRKALSIEYVMYPWLLARLTGDTSALGLSILTQYTW